MQEYKRLFIGVKVDPGTTLRKFVDSAKDIFSDSIIKWVPFENYHLTLKFLGQTDINLLEKIGIELYEIARESEPFTMKVEGSGVFKDFFKPQVLWTGLKEHYPFEIIKTDLENSMSGLGFEIDHRRFRPHMTVARIKHIENRDEFENFIRSYTKTKFQTIDINEIILYESILKPEGPQYVELEKFRIGKTDTTVMKERF